MSDEQIEELSDVLKEQLPLWQQGSHISKADAYALIVLRDNIIGAQQKYKNFKNQETLGRINIIAQLVENFMEQALL